MPNTRPDASDSEPDGSVVPLNSTSSSSSPSYRSAGVDYEALDAGKRDALTQALATSHLLEEAHGGKAHDASRGEPAFAFTVGGQTLAFVLEGLGTKSIIARAVYEQLGVNRFADVAYDAVAAIVNDLCCIGASPLVVNAYFATGSSEWYEDAERGAALLAGWRRACEDAGATWGGGESPSLPELVSRGDIELAGSAVGLIPDGLEPILGQDLQVDDEIVFLASSGLHANGASLARMLANPAEPADPAIDYATPIEGETTFGEALLEPSILYSPLVRNLLEAELPIHYLSHITGHGMLKLMRPSHAFSYEIERLPEVPPVLSFMVERAGMSERAAYSTFNMGCGFVVYCAAGSGADVTAAAQKLGLSAYVAGSVKRGPRRVVLEEKGIVYESDQLDLNARRAA